MPLIVCPECHKQVSDQAVSCPNCGYPSAQKALIDRPSESPGPSPAINTKQVSDCYFYRYRGEIEGPVTAAEIREMLHWATLPSSAQICAAGSDEWEPVTTFLKRPSPPSAPLRETLRAVQQVRVPKDFTVREPIGWKLYCRKDDQTVIGPFPQKEIESQIKKGYMSPNILVCQEGQETWQPFHQWKARMISEGLGAALKAFIWVLILGGMMIAGALLFLFLSLLQ
jgi:hypothetical protein